MDKVTDGDQINHDCLKTDFEVLVLGVVAEPRSPSLEDVMSGALSSLLPNPLGTSSSARAKLYDRLQCETDKYGRDFMKNQTPHG